MIISASRREDIPAFRAEETFKALESGHILCMNPFNQAQYKLVVEKGALIVWWSKNYAPWLEAVQAHQNLLDDFQHYFQYTMNTDSLLERDPDIWASNRQGICQALSTIGNVVWRYDPITYYKVKGVLYCSYNAWAFKQLDLLLMPHVHHLVISFCDLYPKVKARFKRHGLELVDSTLTQRQVIVTQIKSLTRLEVRACCEKGLDLPEAACIPGNEKDPHQRPGCACAKATDIGYYGRCQHHCLYCYAKD